ncbi:hypothetical protein PAECIP111890_05067 [Paenibacillus sp. JJ-223]|nr:hypothetical protein PAECIP111890_05067 [Paenibacillus sp. JJ-223]
MKHVSDLKQRIEEILDTSMNTFQFTLDEWSQYENLLLSSNDRANNSTVMLGVERSADCAGSLTIDQQIYFKIGRSADREHVICWGCSSDHLTIESRRLIELLISSHSDEALHEQTVGEGNGQAQLLIELGTWLLEQMNLSNEGYSIPERFLAAGLGEHLEQEKIPFLLQGETPDDRRVHSSELNKLLESYFGEDIVLIPLGEQEWVFFGSVQTVTAEADDDTTEARKELLNAFCLGLYELIASEWAGGFHLSAALPCVPYQQLISVTSTLRESVKLGRSFHVTEHIHLPWNLHLERLVASISEPERLRFIEEIGKNTSLFNDSETMGTLETFFSLDCNVSETAKRMFIHRNTLVYRLDKIKHEIGYDVRSFENAVLVRLLLLMYKVTKKP